MKTINKVGNMSMIEKPSYVCSTDEFKQETTVEDGCQLLVIDESTHKAVGKYIAYHGFWNENKL